MHGIDGSKREAANMIRSLVSELEAGALDRGGGVAGGWQPSAILGQAAVVGDLEQHSLGWSGFDSNADRSAGATCGAGRGAHNGSVGSDA